MASFLFALLVLFAQALIGTYLIKRFTGHQTYVVASLIRIKRKSVLQIFDKFAKNHRLLDIFAELGIILGFGALAVDYLYGRSLKGSRKIFRLPLFFASAAILAGIFYGFDLLANKIFSQSPMMGSAFPFFAVSFGLFGFAGFMITALAAQAFDILAKLVAGKRPCPGVAPILPGIDVPNVPISVPLHGWVSLFLILVMHEGMHGVVARRLGFKVKSTGFLLFGFLPIGAFVEPDEKQVAAAAPKNALRLFAAGPMANLVSVVFMLAFVFLLTAGISATIGPWAKQTHLESIDGIEITSISEDFDFCGEKFPVPAKGVFAPNMKILKVNGKDVQTTAQLLSETTKLRGQPVTFTVADNLGKTSEKTLAANALGLFGFGLREIPKEGYVLPDNYLLFVQSLAIFNSFVGWLILLSILVAIANYLPVAIFDGGRMSKLLCLPYLGFLKMPKADTEKFIGRLLLWILIPLLLVNALPLFL